MIFLWVLVFVTCRVKSSTYILDNLNPNVYSIIFRYVSDGDEVDHPKFTELHKVHQLNKTMYKVIRHYYAEYYDPMWSMITQTCDTYDIDIPTPITMAMRTPVANFMHVFWVYLKKLHGVRYGSHWRIPNEHQAETTKALVFFHALFAFQYENSFTFPATFTWILNGLQTPTEQRCMTMRYYWESNILQDRRLEYDINTNHIKGGFPEDRDQIISSLPLLVQFENPSDKKSSIMVHITHFRKFDDTFVAEGFFRSRDWYKIWLHYSNEMKKYVGEGEYFSEEHREHRPIPVEIYLRWSNNHPLTNHML